MIAEEFEFHAPRSAEDAVALLERYGGEATLLAGGMSLLPTMNLGLARPAAVVSLNHVAGLAGIVEEGEALRIGATTRHREVAASERIRRHCPLLAEAASVIGDVQVRNRGTIGGSVAHADPAADYLPVLAVTDATVVLLGPGGRRAVPLREFVVGMMSTLLAPSELVVELEVPKLPAGAGSCYLALRRLEGSFSIVNAAAIVDGRSARVGLGGATPRPVLVEVRLERGLDEGALRTLGEAAFEACADAFGDLAGDAEYRREMARVYARRAALEAERRRAGPTH